MPTLFNHSHHFNAGPYLCHSPEKYKDMIINGGLDSMKALACTSPDDAIQLDPRLRDEYEYMADHLGSTGLVTAKDVVWDLSSDVIRSFDDYSLSVYRFSPEIDSVRPDPKRLKATDNVNNKNFFIEHCLDNGFRVPKTLCFNGASPSPLRV